MSAVDSRPAPFVPQIESLRGVAAMGVAYSHCSIAVIFHAEPLREIDAFFLNFVLLPVTWLLNGNAAVILFFVISGLVLSLALDKAPALRSFKTFGMFVVRRALRIFPAHLAALIVFVPLAYLTVFRIPVSDPEALNATTSGFKLWLDGTVYGHLNKREWLNTALLYNNYYNPVTWSLKVEILGSLCVPFFAAVSRRPRLDLDIGMLAVLLGMAALVDTTKAPNNFLLYLPAFYLGCMARTHGRRLGAALGATPRTRLVVLLSFLLLFLAPAVIIGQTNFAYFALTSFGACGVVAVVAWGGGAWIDAALLHPALRRLGRISYSFYLWHILILLAFVRAVFIVMSPEVISRHYVLVQVGTMVVSIALSLAVATLSYAFVESPIIALGRRMAPHRKSMGTGTDL